MGTDIRTFAERRKADGSWEEIQSIDFLSNRVYGMFGFLANVRNYSMVPPIALPRGLPEDVTSSIGKDYEYESYAYSPSWLSLNELLEFNYDDTFENRRVKIDTNHGCTCEPGMGKMTTFREILGEDFQRDLLMLQAIGAERIIFWFVP